MQQLRIPRYITAFVYNITITTIQIIKYVFINVYIILFNVLFYYNSGHKRT